jgi:hypothetical protein
VGEAEAGAVRQVAVPDGDGRRRLVGEQRVVRQLLQQS